MGVFGFGCSAKGGGAAAGVVTGSAITIDGGAMTAMLEDEIVAEYSGCARYEVCNG